MTGPPATYFVAKCQNMQSLQKCIQTANWACRNRVSPPHPPDILRAAVMQGKLFLLFSVNNCHGWHGYCEVLESPKPEVSPTETSVASETSAQSKDKTLNEGTGSDKNTPRDSAQAWHHFKVRWICQFLSDYGERCLDFSATEDLVLEDGSPLSKSRNWQQVPGQVGQTLCERLEAAVQALADKRRQAERERLEQLPAPFFTEPGTQSGDTGRFWEKVVAKVERELGPVHLACPFGSQRYNTATPQSDIDIFIVYQAKTRDILGFDPPKQTIKNRDVEACDYTVLELHRYTELLVSGDPRCVETLFLADSSIMAASPQWRHLQQLRQPLLSQQCLEKYLKDAQGSNGTKQLQKWTQEVPDTGSLTARVSKLVYIVLRLLQNARDVVQGGPLTVFREPGSRDLQLLMQARQCQLTKDQAWAEVQRLQEEIEEKRGQVEEDGKGKAAVEDWLLQQRYRDFISHQPSQHSQHTQQSQPSQHTQQSQPSQHSQQ